MTTAELRAQLLSDLSDFRSGKIPAARLRASCAAVRAICDTVKIEIAAATMMKTQLDPVRLTGPAATSPVSLAA